jgi:branched-chain amino acid transport system substrate-binding protein
MKLGDLRRVCWAAAAVVLLTLPTVRAEEPAKTLKIGVVPDLTGPFAGGGSEPQYRGAKIIFDWFGQQGGIDGYKVELIYADS